LVKEIVKDFLKWNVVVNTGDSILDAIDICEKYGYSFWDSMIIEAAIKGGAVILMFEDLQDGQVISGVSIRNPFKS
jgi:predicted nucleic acid-binding protein